MSKLVLYSDQVIDENRKVDYELLKLINKYNPSIAYIPSSSDISRKYFNQKIEYYKALGITDLRYFDLDQEYDASKVDEIFKCDAIHLSGGNTFYFLHLLKKREFIDLLKAYVKNGGVLIGISAGSILMTDSIDIAGLGKDADENFVGIEDKSALGLIDFEFAPHWDGENGYIGLLSTYARDKNKVVYACKDGDGIIVDGSKVRLIGDIKTIE